MQLCNAAASYDVAAVECLLQFAHVDINRGKPVESGVRSGPPIVEALLHGADSAKYADQAAVVELLIKAKADVNALDQRVLRSALHHAWSNTSAARALLAAKAHVNALDCVGLLPLHFALQHRSQSAILLLLEHGADAGLEDISVLAPVQPLLQIEKLESQSADVELQWSQCYELIRTHYSGQLAAMLGVFLTKDTAGVVISYITTRLPPPSRPVVDSVASQEY